MIEEELYLELQNFSFVRNTSSAKQMPWASKSSPGSFTPTSSNIAQSMHKLSKKTSNHNLNKKSLNDIPKSPTIKTEKSDDTFIVQEDLFPNSCNKNQQTPKRKTRSSILKSPIETDDTVIVQDDHLPNLRNKNPPTPTSLKRKTRSSYKTSNNNKAQKLADIATNIIAVADSDPDDE